MKIRTYIKTENSTFWQGLCQIKSELLQFRSLVYPAYSIIHLSKSSTTVVASLSSVRRNKNMRIKP